MVTDLLLTARFYPAERALAPGLVSEVVPDGQARELADRIAANDADCVAALKTLIDRDVQRSTVEGAQLVGNLTVTTKDKSRLTDKRHQGPVVRSRLIAVLQASCWLDRRARLFVTPNEDRELSVPRSRTRLMA